MEYQTADSEHLMKRLRAGQPDEVSFSGSTHPNNMHSSDDLPKTVVRSLSLGSNVMSMDFHPQQQTILLVGTNVGDISIWEVGSRERQLWLKMPQYLLIDVFGAQMDPYLVLLFPSTLFRYIHIIHLESKTTLRNRCPCRWC